MADHVAVMAAVVAASPEPRVSTSSRVWFVNNLRIALVSLVVVHHVALTYGAAGLFYYVEFHPDGLSRALLIFVLVNQAWFMGAFFLIAGYFTPGSFERKGSVSFLRDRVLRLGLPLVGYVLLLNPLAFVANFFVADFLEPLDWDTYEYLDYVRMGPMWFVAMLLIFSFGYAAWRLVPRAPREGASRPRYPAIAIFAVVLASLSFLLRMEIAG